MRSYNLVQFQSSSLNNNVGMYLYDTPRDRMAKDPSSRDYALHQNGRLQGLFPTLPIIFSCVPELLAQHKCKYSCALELLAQHKTLITHVLQSPSPNTKHLLPMCSTSPRSTQTSHQSCASLSMPNTKQAYIYREQLAYA